MPSWDTVFVECLKEMFRRVGERYPNKKLTNQNNWFRHRSWSQDEEEDFKKWMVKHLRKRTRCLKLRAEKEAGYFLLMYGWNMPHDDGTLTVLGKEKRL